jgi:lipopolysaccharide transport system ATP-binding protein
MSSEPVIRVRSVSKAFPVYERPSDRLRQYVLPRLRRMLGAPPRQYYREYWALREVDFEVRPGEQVGIVGRNGAGKSTLLQVICGTLEPTGGSVEVAGRIAALLELGAGFNPELTGRENVFLNGSVLGLDRALLEERFDEIVAFADIPGFIDQPVKSYSSGMFMRLAFAVAVHVDPQILIVDEALSVGDEGFQRKCLARLEAMRSRGTTILFVSHSAQTVIQLCDRALWIEDGRLLLDGSPKAVLDAYHLSLGAGIPRLVEADGIEDGEARPAALPYSSAMVEYPQAGGRIVDAVLSDDHGHPVARLEHGRRYRFAYRLQLTEAARDLRCGMLLKTRTGVEVAGAVVEPGVPCDAGESVQVEFAFTCLLAPGRYFVNCGVMASQSGTDRYVHRLVDAFEVDVVHPSRLNAGGVLPAGLVDLEFGGRATLRSVSTGPRT